MVRNNSETTQETTEGGQEISKYKTELCKNWVQTGECGYQSRCKFAHGEQEIASYLKPKTVNDKIKTKNCRSFYQLKTCPYGSRCMFRHEHRAFTQIFRHYYVPHLTVLEQLFDHSKDKDAFLKGFESEVPRLSVFRQIESEEDSSEESDEGQEIYSAYRDNLAMLKDRAAFKDFTLQL